MISGTRWYRAFPSALTQTVVASKSALWVGGDPSSTYPYAPITQVQTFSSQSTKAPVSFASVRDPAANNGNGSDILVICGFTGPYGFASGKIQMIGSGSSATGNTVTLTINGTSIGPYTVLATDTTQTVAAALVNLINESTLVLAGSPVLGQAYSIGSTIHIGALVSGSAGNSITYSGAVVGGGIIINPTSPTNFTGGGATTSGPLKWDGTTVSGLSYQITNAFTGCVTWHNHVWYWGDPNNPDTLFASDIDEPEGFTFMSINGGYDIGPGDGDPSIRGCWPIGNILYVFKGNSIYAITGYDFQSGEYQFQVQPAIQGHGTPNSQSAAVLENSIVFWDGHSFYRLRAGAFDLEHIGRTIPVTSGLCSKGDQSLVRATAGSFIVQSSLNESFNATATSATEIFSRVAFFAMDTGNGQADTVLVFDDDASAQLGNYAWAPWSGWVVGGWIKLGNGPSASGMVEEPSLLCFANELNPQGTPQVFAYGTDPMADEGLPIQWLAQTGWITMTTSALEKQLHTLYLDCESSPGMVLSFTITPSVTSFANGNPTIYAPFQSAFGATGGTAGAELHQTMVAKVEPFLRANAYIFAFGEDTGTSSFELIGITLDYIEEPFKP